MVQCETCFNRKLGLTWKHLKSTKKTVTLKTGNINTWEKQRKGSLKENCLNVYLYWTFIGGLVDYGLWLVYWLKQFLSINNGKECWFVSIIYSIFTFIQYFELQTNYSSLLTICNQVDCPSFLTLYLFTNSKPMSIVAVSCGHCCLDSTCVPLISLGTLNGQKPQKLFSHFPFVILLSSWALHELPVYFIFSLSLCSFIMMMQFIIVLLPFPCFQVLLIQTG